MNQPAQRRVPGQSERPDVITWLLDSDPSIRWQVMRDILDLPRPEWAAERTRVETEGWGAQLLAVQDDDGQRAGGAHFPAAFVWPGPEAFQGPGKPWRGEGQPWTSTSHVLALLREFGTDPDSDRMQQSVELIGANCRWEHERQPYWEGEVVSITAFVSSFVVFAAAYSEVGQTAGVVILLLYFTFWGFQLWAGLAVTAKRWHDRDKSGAWTLVFWIPAIGPIWLFIEAALMRGTVGRNRFGPDPNTGTLTPAPTR